MSNSLKILMIVFSIILGNVIFYNFQPQEIILSSKDLNNNIEKNIKNFSINQENLEIKNISTIVNDKKEFVIEFNLDKNINIKSINEFSPNSNKITNLSSTILLNDFKTNMNIDDLNIQVKNKLENLDFDFIKNNDVKHIFYIENFNNDFKLSYNSYDIGIFVVMMYLSMFLSLFGLIYGVVFVLKFLYSRNFFQKYIISIKLLKK